MDNAQLSYLARKRQQWYVFAWIIVMILSPVIGSLIIVEFGFEVLHIPVGLGGGMYAYLFAPLIFAPFLGIYHFTVYRVFNAVLNGVNFWLVNVGIPIILWVVFIVMTTQVETGGYFYQELFKPH